MLLSLKICLKSYKNKIIDVLDCGQRAVEMCISEAFGWFHDEQFDQNGYENFCQSDV